LLVANDGGHLAQLYELSTRLPVGDEVVWVTVPTPQSESLLEGRTVAWSGSAITRDYVAVARNARLIAQVIRRHRPDVAVSTGSSLALSSLPQCAARGIAAHYIESVTRSSDYSLTGRILNRTPRVHTYTQWKHLATGGWAYRGSVLDRYVVSESTHAATPRSVVVSLGTSTKYGFRRLVERLVEVIPIGVEVFWQVGSTDVADLGIEAHRQVATATLEERIASSDVLIAHAGAGICLTALRLGKAPVLVPRRPELDEHIDDHQIQLARLMSERGYAVSAEADAVEWKLICAAAGRRAATTQTAPPFELAGSP
jgi:UDP-N-acetylglucosamine transferase subunit ALG13